jgi:hypothetical protein
MTKTFPFLVVMFVAVFAAGFLSGYFTERSGMLYTKSEIEELRNDVENMQIQELFVSGKQVDCNLMASAMGSHSYHLWDLVNKLKSTRPETEEFYDMKRQADFLSLRAWIFANNIKENCWGDILPILYIYSVNCPDCDEQDRILQTIKNEHQGVFVYAIDYYLEEPSIKLVRDAYNITSVPSMIIDNKLYGKLEMEELEGVVCENIGC